jgi:parafibromin
MKDHDDRSTCLVGCRSHVTDGPAQSDTLDAEILSYFLTRRAFNNTDSGTIPTQQGGNTQDNETASSSRQKRVGRHFRNPSSQRSPKAPNSAESRGSRRSKSSKRHSIDSSLSASSRYPRITDWSAGMNSTDPSLFCPPKHNPVDPPRPPKPGHEWVWFPEGFWAEREIRRFTPPINVTKQKSGNKSTGQNSQITEKRRSIVQATNEDKNVNVNKTSSNFIPQIKIGSVSLKSITFPSRRTSRHSSGDSQESYNLWRLTFNKPVHQEETTNPAQQREGLYCRTKRNIEALFHKRVRVRSS